MVGAGGRKNHVRAPISRPSFRPFCSARESTLREKKERRILSPSGSKGRRRKRKGNKSDSYQLGVGPRRKEKEESASNSVIIKGGRGRREEQEDSFSPFEERGGAVFHYPWGRGKGERNVSSFFWSTMSRRRGGRRGRREVVHDAYLP